MAAMPSSVLIRCPACREEIELPTEAVIDRTSGPAQYLVQVDTRPIREHVQSHTDAD